MRGLTVRPLSFSGGWVRCRGGPRGADRLRAASTRSSRSCCQPDFEPSDYICFGRPKHVRRGGRRYVYLVSLAGVQSPDRRTRLRLTSNMTLINFGSMFASAMRTKKRARCLVSAAVLVFVFFLPLHFHFSLSAKVSKECSCVHGTRTQLAPHADSPTVAPTLQVTVLVTQYVFSWAGDWSTLQNVRGPPTSLSV